MARSLASKPNVVSPGGDYPYGRIKDNPGDNSGTPVNEEVYGDFHQFFAKLLAQAGFAANGNPENSANGFQYNEAVDEIIDDALALLEADLLGEIDNLQDQIDVFGNKVIIEIGDWNIYVTGGGTGSATKSVPHGLSANVFKKIREMSVVVRNDADTDYYPIATVATIRVDNTHVHLASILDFAGFQNEGGYNRGWITIMYVD